MFQVAKQLRVERTAGLFQFDGIEDRREMALWHEAYGNAVPFPHIVLDGLFPDALLRAIVDEIAGATIDGEKNIYASFKKHKASDLAKLPSALLRA
jgi:hypothetical protein